MKNRFVHYGAVLLIIAAVSAGVLGLVNNFTKTVIEENDRKAVNQARMKVLTAASDFREAEAVQADGLDFIPGYNEAGEIVGYVTTVAAGGGYAGDIVFVMGITKDAKIAGMDIIGCQETPGLGAKVQDRAWQDSWAGRDSSYEFNKSTDAFAGATISPTAVYNGLIKTLKAYETGVRK